MTRLVKGMPENYRKHCYLIDGPMTVRGQSTLILQNNALSIFLIKWGIFNKIVFLMKYF